MWSINSGMAVPAPLPVVKIIQRDLTPYPGIVTNVQRFDLAIGAVARNYSFSQVSLLTEGAKSINDPQCDLYSVSVKAIMLLDRY